MVVLSGAVLSGWYAWYGMVWYAWYAAFSQMHIKYKYGLRDWDDFGDFFLSSSNSLKIALVTCCCRGNCRNSETSAMSGGFSTKGQCWSGLPWKWLKVFRRVVMEHLLIVFTHLPAPDAAWVPHPPICPQRVIWGGERQAKDCCLVIGCFSHSQLVAKQGLGTLRLGCQPPRSERQLRWGARWKAAQGEMLCTWYQRTVHLISFHTAPDISAPCTWCTPLCAWYQSTVHLISVDSAPDISPQCTWYQCMAGGFGAVWCTEEQHSNKTETTPSNSDQQTWLHAKRKL